MALKKVLGLSTLLLSTFFSTGAEAGKRVPRVQPVNQKLTTIGLETSYYPYGQSHAEVWLWVT